MLAETSEVEVSDISGTELREKRFKRGRKCKDQQVPTVGSTKPSAAPKELFDGGCIDVLVRFSGPWPVATSISCTYFK